MATELNKTESLTLNDRFHLRRRTKDIALKTEKSIRRKSALCYFRFKRFLWQLVVHREETLTQDFKKLMFSIQIRLTLWRNKRTGGETALIAVKKNAREHTGTARAIEFEQLVTRYQQRMVALAFHMLGNLEEARDQSQEAFVRFWQHKHWPEDTGADFAYLARIVINLCIDRLRKRKRHRVFFLDDATESYLLSSEEPDHDMEAEELRALMESAVTHLKPRQKAIFILRDVEGYSVMETAKIIGCSGNNVLVNLHKARKNLRKWLAPHLNT